LHHSHIFKSTTPTTLVSQDNPIYIGSTIIDVPSIGLYNKAFQLRRFRCLCCISTL